MKFAKLSAILICPALAAACTTPSGSPGEPVDRVAGENGTCSTAGTESFIGQRATAAIGTEIRQRTGADVFQWVAPDTAVTMDYRPDRVRVSYDRAMAITEISCG
ncbi:MAG: peptidase inhibitor I78 [Alphaproteobacteria bacterium]|nr:peptidase inhibitor I78 [Alphaproteobacteria bacterium]